MTAKRLRLMAGATMLLGAALIPHGYAADGSAHYSVGAHWKIGGTGGWDLLEVDSVARRLYVSHADRVVVLDADNGRIVGEITHTDGVHGIAIAPDLGRGFTSNGKSNSLTVFDPKTLERTGEVTIDGQSPDIILYEAGSHRLYVFNGRSANASVIDAKSLAAVGTIALGGKPEFAVSDGHGRLFVNIEDKNELAVIDAAALKVSARWPLKDCDEPTGLAFDSTHHRLFSVCGNKTMVVTDSTNGRRVASVPIGGGPDGVVFDESRGLLFSPNGADGTLTVVHQDDADHYRVVDTVATQKSARTIALDAKTHRLFLPAAELGATPAPTTVQPHPRPAIVPDSFTLLVVGS